MRLSAALLVLLLCLGLSGAVWMLTGGHVAVLVLPLLLGLPFVWRGRS